MNHVTRGLAALLASCLLFSACPSGPGSSSDGTPIPTRSASGQIEVVSPARGEQVAKPFTIKGKARVHEGVVSYRLRSPAGLLTEGTTLAKAPDVDQFGPFEVQLSWDSPVPPGTRAELEVFARKPSDGGPDHVVTIPVIVR